MGGRFFRFLSLVVLAFSTQSVLAADKPTHPVVLVPGILGSKLCDEKKNVLWGGNAVQSLRTFRRLDLSGERPEKISACGLVEETQVLGPLYSIRAYRDLIREFGSWGLNEKAGNLLVFDYDWRASSTDNALELERFVRNRLGTEARFNIVAHSMGGIIGRLYLERPDGRRRVNKIIYLGTPFLGSMNTLGTLSEGWGSPANLLAGGVEVIRRVALSFPSYLELLPRYQPCCEAKLPSGRYEAIDVFDPTRWKDSRWLVDPHSAGQGFERFAANLRRARSIGEILERPAPDNVPEIRFAGDPKETRLRFEVRADPSEPSPASWRFSFERGDGTVPLWSAARDVTLKSAAGTLHSFSEHATIFDDKWVRKELQRELFTAEAILDRPISGSGRPEVAIMNQGIRQLVPTTRVRIVPSEVYLTLGKDIETTVTMRFGNEVTGMPLGAYSPRIEIRQGETRRGVVTKDITTLDEAANNTLRFLVRAGTAGLEEGVAEIAMSVSGAAQETTLHEYVVLVRGGAR